jgi:hypothetical protein
MLRIRLDAYTGLDRLRLAISGDYLRGEVTRSEGGVKMHLVDPVLAVEAEGVDFSTIHPDILALIGVLAFHPVLPDEEFELRANFPMSAAVEAAMSRPWILPGLRVPEARTTTPYRADRDVVLSYGGGIDSLAAHVLLPDVPVVHETPLPGRRTMYRDVVNRIVTRLPVTGYSVSDNLRQLYSTWGLPLWVSVYIASLVLQPRNIVSGSEMTGTYLLGGQRYHPRYKNLWYRVFSDLGVSILPTSFLSEIGNARVVHHHGRMRQAAYCQYIDRKDCDSCTKCLRRRTIRAAVDPDDAVLVDTFTRTDQIERFLSSRPLYYGDVFLHAASMQHTWVSDHLADLLDRHGSLPFHDAYLPDTFEHFGWPAGLRGRVERGLHEVGMGPFSAFDRARFESYEQVAPAGT